MGWLRRKRKEKYVPEQPQPKQQQSHHLHDITEDDLALVWQELRRLRESQDQSNTSFRDHNQSASREEEAKIGDVHKKRSQGRSSENPNRCQANPCNTWEPWEGYRQHHVKINDPNVGGDCRAETGELLQEFLKDHVAMIAPMNPVGCQARTGELVEEFVQDHVAMITLMVPTGCEPRRGAWDSSITDKLPACSSPYEIADDAVKLFRTRISDEYCTMPKELSLCNARRVPTKKTTFFQANVPASKYMNELSKANRTLLPPTETKKEQNKNQDPTDLMHMLVLMKKVYTFLAVGKHDMVQLLSISALLQRVDSKLSGWKTTNVFPPSKSKLVGADPTSLREKVSSLIDQIADVSDSYFFVRDPRKSENFDDDDMTIFDDDTFDYSLDSTLADSLTATLSLDESLTLSHEKDDGSLTIPSIRSFIRLDDSDSDTLSNDNTVSKKLSDDSDSVAADDTIRKDINVTISSTNKYHNDTFDDEVSLSSDSVRVGDGYHSAVEKKRRDGILEYHRNRVSLACCIAGGKRPSHHDEDEVVKVHESERSHAPTIATSGSTAKSSSMASKKHESLRSRASTLSSTVRAARTNSYDSLMKKKEFMKRLREISREHGGYTGRSGRHHPPSRSSKGSFGHPLPFTILRIVDDDNSTLSDFSFRDEKAYNSGGGSSRHWSETKSTSNSTGHSTANSTGHWSGNLTITEVRGTTGRRVIRQFDTEVL